MRLPVHCTCDECEASRQVQVNRQATFRACFVALSLITIAEFAALIWS